MVKQNILKITIFLTTLFISCQGSSSTVIIETPTIQCGMCKEAIESGLKKTSGVVTANVDMRTKKASVTFDINKTDLPRIEKVISELGYVANTTLANPDVYANLPICCKIPDSN